MSCRVGRIADKRQDVVFGVVGTESPGRFRKSAIPASLAIDGAFAGVFANLGDASVIEPPELHNSGSQVSSAGDWWGRSMGDSHPSLFKSIFYIHLWTGLGW